MELILKKKPKNPTIIEGFPGFGLVGTIATEFLLEHLDVEQIGKITFNEGPAMIAIHDGKMVEPLGIFYNKKHNLILVHAVTATVDKEWAIADIIHKLSKDLGAKEIISLEGVGSGEDSTGDGKVFFYTNNEKKKKVMSKIKVPPLKEGIIVGVTGAMMSRVESTIVTAFFADTHSKLPDSKAAARVIEVLDNYLGLKVDTKPLLEQAKNFEDKLKGIMQKGSEAQELSERKKMSYVG
tara:strand:+ start:1975 stop:2688 length:714 start_codon:yes stop_codon:yes gene_type:complete